VLQYSAAARRRSPCPSEESRVGRSYLEVSPIELALNRLTLYFLAFEADGLTHVGSSG